MNKYLKIFSGLVLGAMFCSSVFAGTYSRTYSFTDGTTAYGSQIAAELDALGTSVNNIVNAQIATGAAISDAKLAQIVTPSKVSGAAITLLTSVPSGAGELPSANLNIATQAEMETATDTDVLVTAGRSKFHPAVAKAWARFNGTGTPTISTSHNIDSSITDNGTGDYTLSFTTDFSHATPCVVANAGGTGGTDDQFVGINSSAAGTVRIEIWNTSSTAEDAEIVNVVAFGDQS